jgi:Surp module.
MEILLKMKQASNPHFGFLSFDNPLYPFYRHVLSAIQSGRYMPGTYEQQSKSLLFFPSSLSFNFRIFFFLLEFLSIYGWDNNLSLNLSTNLNCFLIGSFGITKYN